MPASMGQLVSFEALAYAGYLIWLLAGLADFACHRRARLPDSSGLRESNFHLGQIALLGGGILLWLGFEPSGALFLLCLILAFSHAWAGYLDTRSAYGVRPITPLEQHLHSILDIAPWIALAMLGWVVTSTHPPLDGEGLVLRTNRLPISTWIAVLLPASVLVVLPAYAERRACHRMRRQQMN